ncbi:response regulator [Pseudomonas sp. XS1P51]
MTKSFLIVDDSLISRMMTKNIVIKLRPDWVIFEAATGAEAISLCQAHPIDLISMDFNMPGITGIEAATEILKGRPSTRIAIMTANIQNAIQAKILESGLTFVAKPFTDSKGPELLKALGE